MFERFTDKGRKIIILAREEAERHQNDYLGTEHLVLAILRETDGIALMIIKKMGLSTEQIRLEIALLYHFLKHWTAKVGYVFESFTKHDWRTDGLNPFLPAAGSSIWLGNDLRNFTAHTILATVGYQFK